jgi:ABC-2 type transport system ATP-binding protein
MKSPLILKNLTKSYGDFKAVDDVSFDLEPGEIFGLLGPNGAGKTTLISCIVTLEKPSKGEILVCGHNIKHRSEEKLAKAELGYVPQEVINHGYFTTKEILQFYSGFLGIIKNNERIDYLLERLALYQHKDKKVKQLSGGMKRRLMIAKSLVHNPKVLLLDEPTAGVDIELRSSLWDFVKELKEDGTTVLLTTHYLEEAEQLCDRIGVIHHGRILKIDQTSRLISDLTFRRMHLTLKDSPKSINQNSSHLKTINGKELVLEFSSQLSVGQIIDDIGVDLNNVVDLQLKEGSLEDAFIKILDQDGKEV